MPREKTGIETPINAKTVISPSESPPALTAEITPTLNPKKSPMMPATIPIRRRMMKATISVSPLVLDPHLGARVERVAQAVAEDVQREHGQDERDPRDETEPRRGLDLVLPAGDQVSPGRARRAHAGAEEREPRPGDGVVGDGQREEDEDGRRHGGEERGGNDSPRPRP